MQKQKNRKGQFGRPPHNVRFDSTSYADTALNCRMVDQIGQSLGSLLGNCCCAGPVRDAHGRKFTTFPYWVKRNDFLVK